MLNIGQLIKYLVPNGYTLPIVPELEDLTVGGQPLFVLLDMFLFFLLEKFLFLVAGKHVFLRNCAKSSLEL